MSCCGNHNQENHQNGQQGHADHHGQHGGGHQSHKWMMIIGCVLPIVLAAAFFLTKGSSGSAGNWLPLLLVLLCPLSHLVMMPLMNRGKHDHHPQA